MTQSELHNALFRFEMPGYILGLNREPGAETRYVSHIYKGSFPEPEKPMCKFGWNRDGGTGFSIWRNNIGLGICRNCLKNTLKELGTNPHTL